MLKLHPRESYNNVIKHPIIIKTEDNQLGHDTIEHIELSLKEMRFRRIRSCKKKKKMNMDLAFTYFS